MQRFIEKTKRPTADTDFIDSMGEEQETAFAVKSKLAQANLTVLNKGKGRLRQ
jgi:hypothetical protein